MKDMAGKGDMGRRRGFGLRREKRKEKEIGPKEKERGARVWAGLKAGEREKSWFSILNLIQTFQSKFKFNEFKFKLNNKQLNDAKQHECNKTTSFNF